MKNKNYFLKDKIHNHFMNGGKKELCEKFILKSVKTLQKATNKNHKTLIKSAIINTAPVIEMKRIKKKNRKTIKEFPFVLNKKNRITLSIKSMLTLLNKKSRIRSEKILSNELLLNSQNKSDVLKSKKNSQKLILLKKKYVFFRWFC